MLQAEEQHTAEVKARHFPGVPWLRLHISPAGDMSSIPDQGTKILHAVRHGQGKKKKKVETRKCLTGCKNWKMFHGEACREWINEAGKAGRG